MRCSGSSLRPSEPLLPSPATSSEVAPLASLLMPRPMASSEPVDIFCRLGGGGGASAAAEKARSISAARDKRTSMLTGTRPAQFEMGEASRPWHVEGVSVEKIDPKMDRGLLMPIQVDSCSRGAAQPK